MMRLLKWTTVFVCILYLQVQPLFRIAKAEAKPAQETLLKEPRDNENTMQIKLIHRNHHESPFRKQSKTGVESLRSLLHQDKLRLTTLSASIQNPKSRKDLAKGFKKPRSIQAPIFSAALFGSGEYFVELRIGTPPKTFLLIADTGSDLIWVNCRHRSKARRRSSSFRFLDSSSSAKFSPISCASKECLKVPASSHNSCNLKNPRSCKYRYSYAHGSSFSTGVYTYETLTIGSSSTAVRIPMVAIGCSKRHRGQSFRSADGVLGLGQGSNSFPSQISHLYGHKFSYCLPSHLNGTFSTPTHLTFGNSRMKHLKSRLQYTPFLKRNETFYYIGIKGIKINGKRLPIRNRESIVDSGSTLSYLLQPGYGILLHAFERLLPYPPVSLPPFDLCFESSRIENVRVPQLSMDFAGGASFGPPVENYFIDVADDVKCLGIVNSPPELGMNVIGNMMLQNFFVEFDRRNSRLGFAPRNCS